MTVVPGIFLSDKNSESGWAFWLENYSLKKERNNFSNLSKDRFWITNLWEANEHFKPNNYHGYFLSVYQRIEADACHKNGDEYSHDHIATGLLLSLMFFENHFHVLSQENTLSDGFVRLLDSLYAQAPPAIQEMVSEQPFNSIQKTSTGFSKAITYSLDLEPEAIKTLRIPTDSSISIVQSKRVNFESLHKEDGFVLVKINRLSEAFVDSEILPRKKWFWIPTHAFPLLTQISTFNVDKAVLFENTQSLQMAAPFTGQFFSNMEAVKGLRSSIYVQGVLKALTQALASIRHDNYIHLFFRAFLFTRELETFIRLKNDSSGWIEPLSLNLDGSLALSLSGEAVENPELLKGFGFSALDIIKNQLFIRKNFDAKRD